MCLARLLPALVLALAVIAIAADASAQEQSRSQDTEVWLVTYGPGEVYWQRFGHNAIWIRDAARGLDHTFNYGFFDFAQKKFFLRFLMGRMLYFSAAQPSDVEFAQYVSENRSIRVQRLALSAQQSASLVNDLLHDIRPENREYLYDYFADNCSTRIRDVLDRAMGGAIRETAETQAASGSLRDHTRRLTQGDFWLYLGLQSALGLRIDRPVDRWQEMFIPAVLADELAARDGLVLEDQLLFESSLAVPPAQPQPVWHHYLLTAIAVAALVFLLSRWLPAAVIARSWFALTGLAGLAILFLWFGTDHRAAALNLNLLIFNPLWLGFVFMRSAGRRALLLVSVFSAAAVFLAFLPFQYTADVVAAFVPLNLAAAFALRRERH